MIGEGGCCSSIVVSDAGPLIAYLDAGAVDVLLLAFDVIYIPEAVHQEVFVARRRVKPTKIKIRVLDTPDGLKRFAELTRRLDVGESEAIALAESLRIPLLIDERAGRHIATECGVVHFTTVDLLQAHVERGRVSRKQAARVISAMRLNGVYLPADTFTA